MRCCVQRRLFLANDPTCHAAWDVFLGDQDRAELKDTLARIVAREKERSTQSRQHLVDILQRLRETEHLSERQATVLVDIVSNGHQFTELVAAAVEVYMSNRDSEEFVDTLKLTAKYAMNVLGQGEAVPAGSSSSSGSDDGSDADGDRRAEGDNEQAVRPRPLPGALWCCCLRRLCVCGCVCAVWLC